MTELALAALLAAAAGIGVEPAPVPEPRAVVVAREGDQLFVPQVQSHTSSRARNPDFPAPHHELLDAAARAGRWSRFAAYECDANPSGSRVRCHFYYRARGGYERKSVLVRPAIASPVLSTSSVESLPPPSYPSSTFR